MAIAVSDREILFIERGRIWRAEGGGTGIVSAADYKIGIVTGDTQIVATNRAYGSTGSKLVVGLYRAAFTGGTPMRLLNRRLSMGVLAPMTPMEGVTASLTSVVTQATILASSSTGNAQASFFGETTAIILEPNTSYVVSLLNGGAQNADVGIAFDFRTDEIMRTHNETP